MNCIIKFSVHPDAPAHARRHPLLAPSPGRPLALAAALAALSLANAALAAEAPPVPDATATTAPADGPLEPEGTPSLTSRVQLGGYGEAQLALEEGEAEAAFKRLVLFAGYQFSDRVRFFSEIEVEDGHELELEQAFLQLAAGRRWGVRAGLLLIPLGIINQSHEPPTFNGVDRPLVDQLILPSTWRELGVGVYADLLDGLHLQANVVTGLDASRFSADRGIGPGRGQGLEVHTEDPALVARLDFDRILGLDIGAGLYYGGAGQDVPELGGVRVGIAEIDARYARRGLSLRAEYARVVVQGADRITDYLRQSDPAAAAVGSAEEGLYLEAGYNVLSPIRGTDQELVPFVRYERLNTQAAVPEGILNPGPSQLGQFLFAGVGWRPHPQVVFKADYRLSLEAEEDDAMSDTMMGGEMAVDHEEMGEGLEGRFALGLGFMF